MDPALAALSAIVGLFGVGAVVFQWRRSGPVVRVELRGGWLVPGGGVCLFDVQAMHLERPPEPHSTPVLAVQATNVGRSAVDVMSWWVMVGSLRLGMNSPVDEDILQTLGTHLDPSFISDVLEKNVLNSHNAPCPYRLEPHSQRQWLVNTADVARAVRMVDPADAYLCAEVNLGNGRTATAKQQADPRLLGFEIS